MLWYQKKRFLAIIAALVLVSIWTVLSTNNNSPAAGKLLSVDTLKYALDLSKFSSPASEGDTGTNRKSRSCDQIFGDVFNTLTSGYRRCLLEKLEKKSAWNEMTPAIAYCLGNALWRLLDVKGFENRDDTKLAILPPSDIPATKEFASCTEITLGIGRDIEAELLLRRAQPHCRFFGADPIKTSGSVFQELGPYFELAVADKAGVLTANVLEAGRYLQKNVTAITFAEFILNYVNVTKVDYILIDNEGPEYPFMRELLPGASIEANNISLCQLSIEFHGPFKGYKMTEAEYNQLINDVLSQSAYLPIWSQRASTHTRSFYLNIRDPYCVGKYFRSKWCGNFECYKPSSGS